MLTLRSFKTSVVMLVVIAACFLSSCTGLAGKEDEMIAIKSKAVTNLTRLTQTEFDETYPRISADSKNIVFQAYKNNNFDIWTLNAKSGRGVIQVTNHPNQDKYPTWGHDGQRIIFCSNRLGNLSLWKIKASGIGGVTMITQGRSADFAPDISKGGKVIFTSKGAEYTKKIIKFLGGEAWSIHRDALPYIWTMEKDGTNMTQYGEGADPVWSPDGKKVTFASNVSGNWDIWTMDADGSNMTQITTDKASDVEPCWSPDGKRLAFASERGGNFDIWMMNVDGYGLTQLTINKNRDGGPSWGKDNNIYFHTNRAGNWDIWRMTPILD